MITGYKSIARSFHIPTNTKKKKKKNETKWILITCPINTIIIYTPSKHKKCIIKHTNKSTEEYVEVLGKEHIHKNNFIIWLIYKGYVWVSNFQDQTAKKISILVRMLTFQSQTLLLWHEKVSTIDMQALRNYSLVTGRIIQIVLYVKRQQHNNLLLPSQSSREK
jgi:hypothetical protein